MIVSPKVAARIEVGRKTQHRLPRTTDEFRIPAGHTFPVTVMRPNADLGYRRKPKRGEAKPRKEGVMVCRARLLEVTPALLHELTPSDALAEGWRFRSEFFADWWERYHEGPGIEGSPEYPVEIPVWALRFTLDASHRPRLLAAASDVNRGYTESPVAAVPDDPGEAVEDLYLERFGRDSQQDKTRRLLDAEERIKERSLEDRLAAVGEAARRNGVDLTRQLLAIERRIDAAEHIVEKYGKAS